MAYYFVQYEGPDLMDFWHQMEKRWKAIPTSGNYDKLEGGFSRWESAAQLILFADDLASARRAANIILAAYCLLNGQIFMTDKIVPLSLDPGELEQLHQIERHRDISFTTEHLAKAAALGARISHRQNQIYALFKYF